METKTAGQNQLRRLLGQGILRMATPFEGWAILELIEKKSNDRIRGLIGR
jgi:hypothetical protein